MAHRLVRSFWWCLQMPYSSVCRHLPFMEALGVPFEVHMFVDTLNAPADAIGGTAFRVAEQLGASLIVTTTDCYVSADQTLMPHGKVSITRRISEQAVAVIVVATTLLNAHSAHLPSLNATAQTVTPAQSTARGGERLQGLQHA